MRTILLFALVFVSNLSFSGSITHHEVSVDTQARTATGTMIAARQSSDSLQGIGCNLYTWSNSQNTAALCWARDSKGKSLSCYTTDAVKVAHIKSLNALGYLYMGSDANGYCSHIITNTQSSNLE